MAELERKEEEEKEEEKKKRRKRRGEEGKRIKGWRGKCTNTLRPTSFLSLHL